MIVRLHLGVAGAAGPFEPLVEVDLGLDQFMLSSLEWPIRLQA